MNRRALFKKHIWNPKRWLRRLLPTGIGQIEILLALLSVVFGKDIDPFESLYAKIPVVGDLLTDSDEPGVSELDDAYWEQGSNKGKARTDGGVGKGFRQGMRDRAPNAPSRNKVGHHLAGALIKFLIIGVPVLVLLIGGVGVASGSGYGNYIANEVGYQATGLNIPLGASLAKAAKTAECFGNIACVRQWQFNNTQRPGSEEVGQEYSLQIEDFSVNDGYPLDIANRRAEDDIPLDFSVYNPSRGLKGIEAKNVAYRVGVYDGTGSLGEESICHTDWKPLGGEYADSNFQENGTILPGGFARPLGTHDLSLKECGLLQPALGIRRTVKLQLAYDYSSQSTLQVEAMSRENMRSLEERPSFKKSKTADTPVKTYVNVESPITYRVKDNGEAESSVFGLRVGFETGQRDVNYKVDTEEFTLHDSRETVDVNNSDDVDSSSITCGDLRRKEPGEDQYTFSSDMKDYLDGRQSDSWFESDSGPSPARCSMVLENPESISATGETLTFRIDANYTVMLEEKVEGFKAINSRCGGSYNCPMLVTDNETSTFSPLISKCETSKRVDANNGCDVRKVGSWTGVSKLNNYDQKIEEGETAYRWKELMERFEGIDNSSFDSPEAIGLTEEIKEKLTGNDAEANAALLGTGTRGSRDVEYQMLDTVLCNEYSKNEYKDVLASQVNEELLYFNVKTVSCGQNSLGDLGWEVATLSLYKSPKERYSNTKSNCEDGVVVATLNGFRCREA